MAHLVEKMMYVGETPWHGLGKQIPEGKKLGIDEALIAAGLDWEVDLRRLYTEDGHTLINITERYAVCRREIILCSASSVLTTPPYRKKSLCMVPAFS